MSDQNASCSDLTQQTTSQSGWIILGTVHFLRGRGGWWDLGGGGHRKKKKTAFKGGHLKKIREKGGSRKIF